MIDAKQANKIAKETLDNADQKQLNKLHESIMETANKGRFAIYVSHHISLVVKQKLQKLGYIVNTSNRRNETSISITW